MGLVSTLCALAFGAFLIDESNLGFHPIFGHRAIADNILPVLRLDPFDDFRRPGGTHDALAHGILITGGRGADDLCHARDGPAVSDFWAQNEHAGTWIEVSRAAG